MQEDTLGFKVDETIIERLKQGKERLVDNDDIFSAQYSKNMEVLKHYFPDIHKEMLAYEPSNKNIFLERDGALNLYFPDTGYTLFSEEPFTQIDQKYRLFREKPARTVINVEANRKKQSRHEYYLSLVQEKKIEKKKDLASYSGLPDFIGGVILFGFDFGYQLIRILDEHHVNHIYIYEENIDLFYYSLFAIDWQWVVTEMEARDSTLHFFLGLDEKSFTNKYLSDIRYNGMYMAAHTFLYMGYSREHIKSVLDEFHDQYSRQVMGWGFFDDGIIGIGQYLSRRTSTFLAVTPNYGTKQGFNKNLDLPVFILGNGPSLDKNIEFVKENADNAIIISCGTTINTLRKYGIKPDYQVDVERLKHTAEKLAYIDKEFLSGITALTVNVMHPDFYEYFDKCLIGLKPSEPISSIMALSKIVSDANRSRLMTMNYSAPIVANLAMSYATLMGFSDVYLIGVDCGFKNPDEHHSKASGYFKDDGTSTGLLEYKRNLVKREANFGGVAYTTGMMDTSRIQLGLSILRAKENNKMFHCYNLSDGIKIEGALPLAVDDALIMQSGVEQKEAVKAYVWKHCSAEDYDANVAADEGLAGIEESFRAFCDDSLGFFEQDIKDKKDLLRVFAQFNANMMKQYYLQTPYHAELMFGSFIYFANEVLDLLLGSPDDCLDTVSEMIELFKELIQEMPDMLASAQDYVDKGRGRLDGKFNG
ncbi:6-hydroxymethylpterin diphosphokinase MptE-like protein [Rhodanobacter aciditrophus]|uniref:6-hydroxymethylpterin diphosphokinase MptE-like protein n=1 Tax=Rhodanobacter aciditrophus TaxID=1623218 RepID=A0ABW4B2F2_9GAMM